MAVTNGYCTKEDLSQRFDLGTGSASDWEIEDAVNAASRAIDAYCGRFFYSASSSTRVFHATDPYLVYIDDVQSVTTLKTDEGDDGTFETTWASTDFETYPLNSVANGVTGHPVTSIRAVAARTFPTGMDRACVQVTGSWGWAAVPSEVRSACLILAGELFKLRDAPFGATGFGDLGIIRVRENPRVQALLAPFCRVGGTAIGVFA